MNNSAQDLSTSLINPSAAPPFMRKTKFRIILTVLNILCSCGLLIWIMLCLDENENALESELETWLLVYSGYLLVNTLFSLTVEFLACVSYIGKRGVSNTMLTIFGVLGFLLFLWVCTGTYWYFTGSEESDLVFVLLVINYCIFGIFLCMVSILYFLGAIFSGFLSLED